MRIEQLPHPDYLKYPKRHTLCFFDREDQAEAAVQAILRQGIHEDDVNVYEGDFGVDAVDADGRHHTLKELWARWAQKFLRTGEWYLVEEADRELRQGHLLVSVLTTTEEQKEDVAELMLLNGGRAIRYVDPLYNEELTPPGHQPR